MSDKVRFHSLKQLVYISRLVKEINNVKPATKWFEIIGVTKRDYSDRIETRHTPEVDTTKFAGVVNIDVKSLMSGWKDE